MKPSYPLLIPLIFAVLSLPAQEIQIGSAYSFNIPRRGNGDSPYAYGRYELKDNFAFQLGLTQIRSKEGEKFPDTYLHFEQHVIRFSDGGGGRGSSFNRRGSSKHQYLGLSFHPFNLSIGQRLKLNTGLRFDFVVRSKVDGTLSVNSPFTNSTESDIEEDLVNGIRMGLQGQIYYDFFTDSIVSLRPFLNFRYGLSSDLKSEVPSRSNSLLLGVSLAKKLN